MGWWEGGRRQSPGPAQPEAWSFLQAAPPHEGSLTTLPDPCPPNAHASGGHRACQGRAKEPWGEAKGSSPHTLDHQCWGPFPPQPKPPKTRASGRSPSPPGILRPITISSAGTVPPGPLGSRGSSHSGGHRLGRVGHRAAPPDQGLTGRWAVPAPAAPPAGQTLHSSNHSLPASWRAGVTPVPNTPRPRAPGPLTLRGWWEGPLWDGHAPHPRGSPCPARTAECLTWGLFPEPTLPPNSLSTHTPSSHPPLVCPALPVCPASVTHKKNPRSGRGPPACNANTAPQLT